jgi:hypothetical protein
VRDGVDEVKFRRERGCGEEGWGVKERGVRVGERKGVN